MSVTLGLQDALGRNSAHGSADMNAVCDTQDKRNGKGPLQIGTSTVVSPHLKGGETEEMAGRRLSLYEQFTVSSHTFRTFSDKYRYASSPCMDHLKITTNQHPCHSRPSSLSYSSNNAQSSTGRRFGTLEGNLVCKKQAPDAGRCLTADHDMFSKDMAATKAAISPEYTMQNISKGLLPPKVPHEIKEKVSVVAGQDTHNADLLMLVKGAECLSIGDGLWSVNTSKNEVVLDHSNESKNKKVLPIIDLQPTALIQNQSCGGQDAQEIKLSGSGLSQDKIMLADVVQPLREGSQGESCMETNDGNHATILYGATVDANLQAKDFMCSKGDLEVIFPSQHIKDSKMLQENHVSNPDLKADEDTDKTGLRMDCRTCQDLATGRTTKFKIAEKPLKEIPLIQSVNDPEAGCALPISPKSVIQAVGQLRFWKARLALLRQQQIFSDQVFELHKLIEVQRLMAGTPDIPMNEIYFGVGNMITDTDDDGLPPGFLEIAECNAESLVPQSSVSQQDCKAKSLVPQSSVSQQDCKAKSIFDAQLLGEKIFVSRESCEAPLIVKDENPTKLKGQFKCPSTMAIVENESKGCRYSSLELVPWKACEPVQTAIDPLPALGFMSRRSDGGQVAAAAGFPVCPTQLTRSRSMQSSHGSIIACHQEICSSGSKVSEKWGPRAPKKHYVFEAPIGSTMINNEPDVSLHQIRLGRSYSINLLEQKRHNKEAKEHVRGKNGNMCRCRADNIPHSPIDSMINAPDNRLLPQGSKKQGSMQTVDLHPEPDVQKTIGFSNEFRGLKRHKDKTKQYQRFGQVTDHQLDGVVSSKPSMSALSLFPSAPTLTSDVGRTRQSGGGKERQGQVVKAVPQAASSASLSAAEILLSLWQEKQS